MERLLGGRFTRKLPPEGTFSFVHLANSFL